MKLIDLTGHRFGRLVVIDQAPNRGNRVMWNCICDCGNRAIVNGGKLRSGHTRSCGCLLKDTVSDLFSTHRETNTPLYRMWYNMKVRCNYPKSDHYRFYGARGITVCPEWEDSYEAFRDWAVESGYVDGLTIERKDNDKGYNPDNCRFIPMRNQFYNTRRNHFVEYNGETKTVSEWSEITGIPYQTLLARLIRYGWTTKDALTTPVRKMNRKVKGDSIDGND